MIRLSISPGYSHRSRTIAAVCRRLTKIFQHAPNKVTIVLVQDRKELEKKIGRRTLPWEVAVTKRDAIFILDPATAYNRRVTQRSIDTILHHELVHVFYNSLIPEGVPYWLNEGLAYVLSAQQFQRFKYPAVTRRALPYYSNFHPNVYHYGPALTEILIERYSLPRIMIALRKFSKTSHSPQDFDRQFGYLLRK